MSQSLSHLTPVRVLAIGAHPDDLELGCGGSLLNLRRLGIATAAVDLTRGELGSRGTPEERASEAAEAGRLLDLKFRINLRLPDGDLEVDASSRLLLIKVIRACRPRVILTHSATGHPDHHKASQLVAEAVHHAGLARIETEQPRHRPENVLFWMQYTQNEKPQLIVDISTVFEEKETVIRAYRSQLHDSSSDRPETYLSRPEFLEQIRGYNRYLGNLAGCAYGEGFLLSRPPRVTSVLDC